MSRPSPETGIFTDVKLTKATGDDNHEAAVGSDLIADEPAGTEILGDCAYGTGDMRGHPIGGDCPDRERACTG